MEYILRRNILRIALDRKIRKNMSTAKIFDFTVHLIKIPESSYLDYRMMIKNILQHQLRLIIRQS